MRSARAQRAATIAMLGWIALATAGAPSAGAGTVGHGARAYGEAAAAFGGWVALVVSIGLGVATGSVDPSVPQAPWMLEVVRHGRSIGWVVGLVLPAWALVATARLAARRRVRRDTTFPGGFRWLWRWCRGAPASYLLLVNVAFLDVAAAERAASAAAEGGLGGWAVAVPAAVLHVVAGAVLLRRCLAAADDRPFAWKTAVPRPLVLLRLAVLTEIWTVGTIAGVSLLLVPGIVWAITVSFAGLLVVDEGRGVGAALAGSVRMTRGLRWRLFKLGALWVPPSLLFGCFGRIAVQTRPATGLPLGELAHAVVVPLVTLLLAFAYRRVGVETATAPAAAESRWWYAPDAALATGWTFAVATPALWHALRAIA